MRRKIVLIGVFIPALICLSIWGYVSGHLPYSPKWTAKNAVLQNLNDPDSASFRNLTETRKDGVKRVCGEVNAKNRMGAFVGFSRFVYSYATEQVDFDPGEYEVKASDVESAEAQCTELRQGGFAWQSTIGSCDERTGEIRQKFLAQKKFDEGWQWKCASD